MGCSLHITITTMLSLDNHHITDLYVVVDDLLPQRNLSKGGRPPALATSEIVTILIWNTLTVRQKLLKDIYHWVQQYHRSDFPGLTTYNTFLEECHRALPALVYALSQLLKTNASLVFIDSTMVPVCKLVRADRHKVAVSIAKFGKNHQGWHYGFKLHASVNTQGQLCGLIFTPANTHDAQMLPYILNAHTNIAVGDTSYTAKVMQRTVWEQYGCGIISPPHPKQTKKLMTWWQGELLKMRPKIETVFDYLKNHLQFVSSFPRSVRGYLLHYVRILLGYQVLVG